MLSRRCKDYKNNFAHLLINFFLDVKLVLWTRTKEIGLVVYERSVALFGNGTRLKFSGAKLVTWYYIVMTQILRKDYTIKKGYELHSPYPFCNLL